ncbi:MAG TPA: glycosyltransferase family 4 protein [Rhodocyclaceae bacterium]|nr:glycosyltransferase family 4 protein [Rhodocyclaceae bacterium]
MMLNVLFLSKGSHSASTRYRALQYFPLLEAAGFRPTHLPIAGGLTNHIRALRAARQADIVVVLRRTPPPPLLHLLRRQARKLVFDFDDAIFCNSDGSPSPTREKRFRAIVQAADHVLAGNQFLAEAARTTNSATTILPTSLDVERYRYDLTKPTQRFDIVWIGSSSTRKYLEHALPALRLAALSVPALRLRIVADFDLPHSGIDIEPIRWSMDSEISALGSAHAGIAPMLDDNWTRGKCALKVLQYMAAGLPVVSSRTGTNAEIIRHGETGFLVDTPEQWRDAITSLAASSELRSRMGRSARQQVRTEYSTSAVSQRLIAALSSLDCRA